jgi:hypothetical protein
MIVEEPPYDLVALFSDLEMQKLFERLIERGQTGRDCTRPFRWRSLRDPRRDTVWREPERPLAPFLRTDCRFLIVWDHQGSGFEERPHEEVEGLALKRLVDVGVSADRILAVALDPELEVSFRTAWPKIKRLVAEPRGIPAPEDAAILAEAARRAPRLRIPDDIYAALASRPKELFEALVRLVRLRRSPDLYTKIGGRVSLRALKSEPALARVASSISLWFPPVA